MPVKSRNLSPNSYLRPTPVAMVIIITKAMAAIAIFIIGAEMLILFFVQAVWQLKYS
jgi:hypothetical protein